MKLFIIKARVPQARVQRLARQLLNCANVTGVCISKHYRVHDDPNDSTQTPVITFVCCAKTALDPQEIITLMTIFVVDMATILGVSYTDAMDDEDLRNVTGRKLNDSSPPKLRLVADNTGEKS